MDKSQFIFKSPLELFHEKKPVTICAPMVRYSKLAFRKLVRKYKCDMCFTPMVISNSFIKSLEARHSDFTTSKVDRPLIVQFAANNQQDFVRAASIVFPYCEGVDLNCGCPQQWAIAEGYGVCLIHKPHLVSDMVKQTRNSIPDASFTISAKIRLHEDIKKTVDFVRQLEAAGLSFITVHGRTQFQHSEPVNLYAIQHIKSVLSIPVVANGDVKTLSDAQHICNSTGVDGVMAARGILANPALFTGFDLPPLACIEDWIKIAIETGTPFSCFHHHLIYMLDKYFSRAEKRYFNVLGSMPGVICYLKEKFNIFI